MTENSPSEGNLIEKANASTNIQLPLTGVRVLDLGHVFQGPYATFLMAMAGAEIIKVEPPLGEMARRRGRDGDYPFRALNSNKRGVVLDLKTERGRELLKELSCKVDVLVENFAPSVMTRLGIGPEVLMAANPRLIYASGSGFGRSGPYSDKVALDLTIQAMSGVMTATGEPGGRPLKAGVPVADMMSGAHLYGAIVTALYERELTGRGRVVEVSMFESMFATLLPAAGHAYVSKSPPKRTGNRHVADSYVPFDTFETADGWVAIVCATDEHWINLTKAMDNAEYRADEDLKNLKGRIARIDEVTETISKWASAHTREQVVALCQAQRVPAAPLLDAVEIVQDPHLHARSFLTNHTTSTGTVALPNSPMRYEGSALLDIKAAPELGADTEAVLAELCNLGETELAALRHGGIIPSIKKADL